MLDVGLIATAAVTMLAPILRGLLKIGAEKATEAAGEKVGEGVVEEIWARLKPKVEAKAGAAASAHELAAAPEDEGAREELAMHLKRILATDPALAAEIAKLVEQGGGTHPVANLHGDGAIAQAGPGGTAVAGGKGSVVIGGHVQGNVRVGKGED